MKNYSILFLMLLATVSCASVEERNLEKKRNIFINSSFEEKKTIVIDIAREFLKVEKINGYEYAEVNISFKTEGNTGGEIMKVCKNKNDGCKEKWDVYKIDKPVWSVFFDTCNNNINCLGGFFKIYIDDSSGEVLYCGGYE